MARERVLVVGAGGREAALAWRLALDPESPEVWLAAESAGGAPRFPRLPIDMRDTRGLADACQREGFALVVIGPEVPLAAGIVNELTGAGVLVYGPSREAARLESSKWFAKQVMLEAGVPTARAEAFESMDEARAGLERFDPPYVIKVDGLAAGKGVCVANDRATAEQSLSECLERQRFGSSGRRVVIEAFLEGEEVSLMAVCDGRAFLMLPPVRDYKRAEDGDRGGNTGGMGAYAPSEALDGGLEREVGRQVIAPMLEAMERRGTPYRGTLYCGLMVRGRDFQVVEFNARFGDPEAQVVLPLLGGSLSRLLASAARGRLDRRAVERRGGHAVVVALVDAGYPDRSHGGGVIEGLESVGTDRVQVFHAAGVIGPGGLRVAGGRAAHVMAHASTKAEARRRVYDAIGSLGGSGWRFRHDIAWDREDTRSVVAAGEEEDVAHPSASGAREARAASEGER